MQLRQTLAIALFALLFTTTTQSSFGFNVFGPDNRQEMTSQEYPWSAIGKVKTVTGNCSGSLVWKDIVLTNAHCVIDPETKKLVKGEILFFANYQNGQHLGRARATHVYWGTTEPNTYRQGDWALLKLDQALGSRVGYFGWKNLDFNKNQNLFSQQMYMAGYSGDFRSGNIAGVHAECSITQNRQNFVLHDCDTTRGASGGPIFIYTEDGPYIVALNAAEFREDGDTSLNKPHYTHEHANIAVKPEQFQAKIRELRAAH